MASAVSALSSIVANGHQILRTIPPPPRFIPYGGFSLVRPEDSDRNPNGTLKRWPQWLLDGKRSPTGRYTFSMWRLWKQTAALLDSGLIGPVKLIPSQEVEIRR